MKKVRRFTDGINHYMARREPLDLKEVYRQVSGQYALILTNTSSLENGADYDGDYEILLGESPVGKFYVYDDGLDIIFDVEKANGTYTHWHPEDIREVLEDIHAIMQGTCKN